MIDCSLSNVSVFQDCQFAEGTHKLHCVPLRSERMLTYKVVSTMISKYLGLTLFTCRPFKADKLCGAIMNRPGL